MFSTKISKLIKLIQMMYHAERSNNELKQSFDFHTIVADGIMLARGNMSLGNRVFDAMVLYAYGDFSII